MAAFKVTGIAPDGTTIDAIRVGGVKRGPGEALSWAMRKFPGLFPGDTVFVVEPLSHRFKKKGKKAPSSWSETQLYLDGKEVEPLPLSEEMIKQGRKKLVELFRKEGLEVPQMEGP